MKRSKRISKLFQEQNGRCAYCHSEMTLELGESRTAELDHVIPTSHLKKEKIDLSEKFNTVACCSLCNDLKADRPLSHVIGYLMHMKQRV